MRKNIIQSKTEPNKNDIWLSEEGLKKYGKNGWEPLGGGGSNDSSLSNKILEIEVSIDNNFPEIKVKDYIDKIVIFKYPYNNAPLFRNYSIISVDSGGHIIEDYYILHYPGNKEITETGYIKVVYRPERLDENIEIILCEDNLLVYPFNPQGDGTKFLSDDGTYKEVSGGSEPYIFDGKMSETKFAELKNAIKNKRPIFLKNGDGYTVIQQAVPTDTGVIMTSIDNYLYNITANNVTLIRQGLAIAKLEILDSVYYYSNTITRDTNFHYGSNFLLEGFGYECNGDFTFGDTVYNVTFPEGVKWSTDSVLEYKPNHTYQFRIFNNRGVMKEFANA